MLSRRGPYSLDAWHATSLRIRDLGLEPLRFTELGRGRAVLRGLVLLGVDDVLVVLRPTANLGLLRFVLLLLLGMPGGRGPGHGRGLTSLLRFQRGGDHPDV